MTTTAPAPTAPATVATHASPCQWTATTTPGLDTVQLLVHGVCQEPTPGFRLTLTRVEGPGLDPATLLLYFQTKAPTGIEPQHVAATPVEYRQTFVLPSAHVPTEVVILGGQATVPVTPGPRHG